MSSLAGGNDRGEQSAATQEGLVTESAVVEEQGVDLGWDLPRDRMCEERVTRGVDGDA